MGYNSISLTIRSLLITILALIAVVIRDWGMDSMALIHLVAQASALIPHKTRLEPLPIQMSFLVMDHQV